MFNTSHFRIFQRHLQSSFEHNSQVIKFHFWFQVNELPICVSRLICFAFELPKALKRYDDSYSLVLHAIRVIFIRSEEHDGAGIRKGFQEKPHETYHTGIPVF
jgi:hypothetical protein